jgi:hypothetical protein
MALYKSAGNRCCTVHLNRCSTISLLHSPRRRSAQDRAFHPSKPCARSPARLRIDNDHDLKGIFGA